MTLRSDMEQEDLRYREEFKEVVKTCPVEQIEAALFRIEEASKNRQREIFKLHRWGEPAILPFPSREDGPPRAA